MIKPILATIVVFLVASSPLLYAIMLKERVVRDNEKYIGEKIVLGNDTLVVINVHYDYVELSNDAEMRVEFLEEFIVK